MKKFFLIAAAVIGLGAAVPNAGAHSCDHAYVIVDGRPVYRPIFFDAHHRCYTWYGPRRVYAADYYYTYPRFYAPRPSIGFTFGFRG